MEQLGNHPHKIQKKIFGICFYIVREKSDYHYIENEKIFILDTNNIILEKHRKIFQEQIDSIRKLLIGHKFDTEQGNEIINKRLMELTEMYDIFIGKLEAKNNELEI